MTVLLLLNIYNISLLSPMGRVDFASNASKRRERYYLKKICGSRRFLVTNLYRLDFHFHSVKPLHLGGGRPLSVRLRLPPLPFHRENLPQRGKQGIEMFIKKQIKPASKPTRVFYKLSRKSFKSVFCLGDNADNLSK